MDVNLHYNRLRSYGGDRNIHPRFFYHSPVEGDLTGTLSWPDINSYGEIRDNVYLSPHDRRSRLYPPRFVDHLEIDASRVLFCPMRTVTHSNGSYLDLLDAVQPPCKIQDLLTIQPRITDQDFFAYNREAFNYFSDVFPEELSLSEFVLGTRQLADLIPKVEESVAKSFTGGYLNKKFGWDNLISDLGVLSSITQSVLERLNFLKRTYGVPTRLGFRRTITSGLTKPIGSVKETNGPDANWRGRYTLTESHVVMRAGCTLLQKLDHLDGLVGLIRGFTGALGLNNPLKVFWVNLPFSFVVDWFFKVSEHLDSLTRLNPAGWGISNVTCSYDHRAVYQVDFVVYPTLLPIQVRPSGTMIVNHYKRFVGLPISIADLMPPANLSPTQLTLFLALLHQQG